MIQKLEAVNRLLTLIRQREITSLEDSLNTDAKRALNVLDRTSRDVQRHGWAFNTEGDFELALTSEGLARLPDNTLSVVVDHYKWRAHPLPVQRGDKLYDPKERTETFTQKVPIRRLVKLLDWEDLPPVAQDYIAARAGRMFAHASLADDRSKNEASLEELQLRRSLLTQYSYDKRANLYNSPDQAMLGRRNQWAQ